jgi:hypothetical protein
LIFEHSLESAPAGRHVVVLPRFTMVGEHDHADAIGLEYGQAVEFHGDLVIGTAEQLERLRSLFESYRSEEANDPEAVEFWESLIGPLAADIGTASYVEPVPVDGGDWLAWFSRRERVGSLALS